MKADRTQSLLYVHCYRCNHDHHCCYRPTVAPGTHRRSMWTRSSPPGGDKPHRPLCLSNTRLRLALSSVTTAHSSMGTVARKLPITPCTTVCELLLCAHCLDVRYRCYHDDQCYNHGRNCPYRDDHCSYHYCQRGEDIGTCGNGSRYPPQRNPRMANNRALLGGNCNTASSLSLYMRMATQNGKQPHTLGRELQTPQAPYIII